MGISSISILICLFIKPELISQHPSHSIAPPVTTSVKSQNSESQTRLNEINTVILNLQCAKIMWRKSEIVSQKYHKQLEQKKTSAAVLTTLYERKKPSFTQTNAIPLLSLQSVTYTVKKGAKIHNSFYVKTTSLHIQFIKHHLQLRQ